MKSKRCVVGFLEAIGGYGMYDKYTLYVCIKYSRNKLKVSLKMFSRGLKHRCQVDKPSCPRLRLGSRLTVKTS